MEAKTVNCVTYSNTVEFKCMHGEVCKTVDHRFLKKLVDTFPVPVEVKNCHFEPKNCCELELKVLPCKATLLRIAHGDLTSRTCRID